MAAIVRLKRRITDEPPETILVSCNKRAKCEENPEENVTTQVLKFAGTVPDKSEEISKHIRNAIKKEKLEREYKRHIGLDVSAHNRMLKKISSNKNRYNIVSQLRAKQLDKIDELDDDEKAAEDKKKEEEEKAEEAAGNSKKKEKMFCLYDMEQENLAASNLIPKEDIVTCNNVPMIKEKVTTSPVSAPNPTSPMSEAEKSYVYDLYYINQPHIDYSWLENITSVDVYRQDNIYLNEQYSDTDDVYEDDDDDSNDENNWRNDYPDEDPHIYDPKKFQDDDDEDEGLAKKEFRADKSDDDDEDDELAAKLERCFLGNDLDDDDDYEEQEFFRYDECGQYSWGYPKPKTYENYMERVLKEMSDT